MIGTLPRGLRGKPPAFVGNPSRGRARRVEALQRLRANFQFAAASGSGQTLVITSAFEDEGKTTVVASLSMALAVAGKDVIAVETDLRRPNLHRLLGAPKPSVGLVDVIEGKAKLKDALQEIQLFRSGGNGRRFDGANADDPSAQPDTRFGGRLRLLAAGGSAIDPTEALSAERVATLAGELRKMATYVIFDSPALLSAGEALPLAAGVDGVVVVARQGHTTRDRARGVRTMLQGLGAEKVAVVLMDANETVRATSD